MARKNVESLGRELANALDGIAPGNEVSQDIRRNLEDPDVAEVDRKVTEAAQTNSKPWAFEAPEVKEENEQRITMRFTESGTEQVKELMAEAEARGREEQSMTEATTIEATEQTTVETKPLTKEDLVRGVLARISEGGYAALPNGTLRIMRSEVDGKFLYKSGDKTPDALDTDGVVKRLKQYKRNILEDQLTVFATIEEGEDAIAEREEQSRARVGIPKRASANADKKHQGRSRANSANGSAKKKVELPKGYALVAGNDLAEGDEIIGRIGRGEEAHYRVVEIHEANPSGGREYKRLMLADPKDRKKEPELFKKFISVTKQVPTRRAS